MNVQPKKSSRTEVDRCDSVLLRMSIQIGNIGSQWKKTIEISQTQYFFTLVKLLNLNDQCLAVIKGVVLDSRLFPE